jgi:hypothetical protein
MEESQTTLKLEQHLYSQLLAAGAVDSGGAPHVAFPSAAPAATAQACPSYTSEIGEGGNALSGVAGGSGAAGQASDAGVGEGGVLVYLTYAGVC